MLELNQSLQAGQKILRAADYQVFLDGEAIIERANRKAEDIVAAAQQEFEEQKKLGFEEGLREGRLQMAEEMMDAVGRAVDYFSRIEKQVAELVAKATRKVIGDLDDDERIMRAVRHALSLTRTQTNIIVRVNVNEAEAVTRQIDEITQPYPVIRHLEVVPDNRLKPGDCILETEMGVVDASIDDQLRAIENSLKKSLGANDS